jgi:hypothetical protein
MFQPSSDLLTHLNVIEEYVEEREVTEGNVIVLQNKVLKHLSKMEGHTFLTNDEIFEDIDIVRAFISIYSIGID